MPRTKKKPSPARLLAMVFGIDSATLRYGVIGVAAFVLAASLSVLSGPVLWSVVAACVVVIAATAIHLKLRPPKKRRSLFGSRTVPDTPQESSTSTSSDYQEPASEPTTYGPLTNLPNSFN